MKPFSAPASAGADLASPAVIAFVIEELTVGGAERMVVDMANVFAEHGWEVHMVLLRSAGELASELDSGVHQYVLNKKPGIDLRLPYRLFRCISNIDPLAVNSHLCVGNTWTRLSLFFTRRKVVATEHSRDSWKPLYYRWMDRILAWRTASLVAVSADTAEFYRDTIGVPDDLLTVINNGVDTRAYASGDGRQLRESWLAPDNETSDTAASQKIVIGTVGRLVIAKNHRRLIDAVKMLVTDSLLERHVIRLVIVGDGEDRESIESYVQSQNLSSTVLFTGARHDIPDVLSAFDLFALSSDREGHPLTALEAQAAGTPVVLTNAGGSGEAIAYFEDQAGGVLVDCSAEALAEALREMILDPELRAERAEFAHRYALAHFDKLRMVQRYATVFHTPSAKLARLTDDTI